MKRIISLLLVLACVFSFVGCGLLKTVMTKDYDAEAKTFTFREMQITLTESFSVDDESDDEIWYESFNETSVSIDKFERTADDKIAFPTTHDYLEALSLDIEAESISDIYQVDGVTYMTYDTETLGFEFTYFLTVLFSDDAIWHVHFICDTEDYPTYKEHFIKWAKTICFTEN